VATEQEQAVFNEHMAPLQAYLDRCQATQDRQLLLDPAVIANVRALRDWAPGSTSWHDADHLCGWFHWLRYEALGDGRGRADRQAAEQLFRDQYRRRPLDLPEALRQRLDAEFRRLFASVMAEVTAETSRRRPKRQRLQEPLASLEMICNFTAYGDPQYIDRLEARAHVAELCRSDMADFYAEEALKAAARNAHQPPPANPPWRPFDWAAYFAN
jgi:hypothetical protein